MPLNGNMKPLIRIDGRKKKNDICMACSWLRAIVLNRKPIGEIGGDEHQQAHRQNSGVAHHRNAEEQPGGADDHQDLDERRRR